MEKHLHHKLYMVIYMHQRGLRSCLSLLEGKFEDLEREISN